MPPFPTVIDASLMSSFRACPRKCALEYFHHYKPKDLSVHLHAGGAFARGLEVAREAFFVHGSSPNQSIALGLAALVEFYGDFSCPPDSAKSLERMMGALEYYFSQYPLGEDLATPATLPGHGHAIEFSFAEPLDLAHPETGDPLIYCGRFDQIVNYAGAVYGEDDKTTSSLGASWPKQWDLRSQFTGYTWGAQRAGIPLAGFLIRGISILKTKYDTLQAITYRPDWQIERWEGQLYRDLDRMIQMWRDDLFDFNLDESCNAYGGCMFRQVCISKDPSPWLEGNFVRRKWDPVTRTETLLGDEE